MEITYTWKVTGIKTTEIPGEPNFVFQTMWKKFGTDELGNTGEFLGATPFPQDPSQVDFIPFNQLTEEMVIGWIQAAAAGEFEAHINSKIEQQIKAKRLPISTPALPWGEQNSYEPPPAPEPVVEEGNDAPTT